MKKDLEEKIHQFALQMHLDGYFCGYDKGRADVLDAIRAEIEELIEWHDCPIEYDNENDAWYREACNQALKIIDKYKTESEE